MRLPSQMPLQSGCSLAVRLSVRLCLDERCMYRLDRLAMPAFQVWNCASAMTRASLDKLSPCWRRETASDLSLSHETPCSPSVP
jgi:hypothetical protein